MMARTRRALPWLVYLVSAAAMIWTRMPWVDESWCAGLGVTHLREGQMRDVGGPLLIEGTRDAPFLELWGLVLSAWFRAFGVDLIRARVLSVAFGGIFLAASVTALKQVGVQRSARAAVVWLSVTNLFFIEVASWLRPDAASLALTMVGAAAGLRWVAGGGRRWLFGAHAALIVASVLHIYACFAGLAFWIAMVSVRRRWRRGELLAFAGPYGLAMLLGVWTFRGRLDVLAFEVTRISEGHIVGHATGIPGAFVRWAGQGRWWEVAAMASFTTVAALGPWCFARDRRTPEAQFLSLVAWACALAWFLTTESGNNYHAVWATPAFMLGIAWAWPLPLGGLGWRVLFVLAPAVLAALGCALVFRVVRGDSRTLYEADLSLFDAQYGLRTESLTGAREIQWHYDFAPHALRNVADGHRPDWFIALLPCDGAPDTQIVGGRTFTLVEVGSVFALYSGGK